MAVEILKNYFNVSVGSILTIHLIANYLAVPIFVQLFICSCATVMIGCITSINMANLKGDKILDPNDK
jgi:hypothetical protein